MKHMQGRSPVWRDPVIGPNTTEKFKAKLETGSVFVSLRLPLCPQAVSCKIYCHYYIVRLIFIIKEYYHDPCVSPD